MLKLSRLGAQDAPRIVLFNALGSTSNVWRPLIKRLEPKYELVLIEYPGFGGSPPAQFSSVAELGAMISETLRSLPRKRHHLIGFSFGSWVAQQLAVDRPEDLLSLSLLGSAPHILELGVQMIGGWLELLERCGLETMLRQLAFWSFTPMTYQAQPGMTANYVKACLAGCEDPAMYRLQLEACVRFRQAVALETLSSPTLLLRGEHDIFFPAICSQMLAERIPGSRCVEIENAGHAMLFENPSSVIGAIDQFLTEASS